MPETDPILPAWLVLPFGALAMIAVAGHFLWLRAAADMDPQRRRIRLTNAVLIMLVIPFVVYGFALATPSKAREYVYVWVVTAALLMMIILVALVDMLHSWRLHRLQLRDLRRQIAAARGMDVRAALLGVERGRAAGGPGEGRGG